MKLTDIIIAIDKKFAEWKYKQGREAQRKRWEGRRAKRKASGIHLRAVKSTKVGSCKGAFGTRPVVDPSDTIKGHAMSIIDRNRIISS